MAKLEPQVQVITVDLTQVLGSLEAMAAQLRAIAAEVDDATRPSSPPDRPT